MDIYIFIYIYTLIYIITSALLQTQNPGSLIAPVFCRYWTGWWSTPLACRGSVVRYRPAHRCAPPATPWPSCSARMLPCPTAASWPPTPPRSPQVRYPHRFLLRACAVNGLLRDIIGKNVKKCAIYLSDKTVSRSLVWRWGSFEVFVLLSCVCAPFR